MKKIFFISAIIFLFLLTSCSYNQDEKEELKKQQIFENNVKCHTLLKNYLTANVKMIKYSEKLNTCLILASINSYSEDEYFIKNQFSGESIFSCKKENDTELIKCNINTVYEKFKDL